MGPKSRPLIPLEGQGEKRVLTELYSCSHSVDGTEPPAVVEWMEERGVPLILDEVTSSVCVEQTVDYYTVQKSSRAKKFSRLHIPIVSSLRSLYSAVHSTA